MRRILLTAALGLFFVSLESALLGGLGIRSFGAGLLLGLLLHLGVRGGGVEGGIGAVVLGFLWDCFAGTPPGLSMVAALAVFLFVRFATHAVDAVPGVIVVLAVLAQGVRVFVLLLLLWLSPAQEAGSSWQLFVGFGIETLVAAAVAPAVYALAHFLDRLVCGSSSDLDGAELWLS